MKRFIALFLALFLLLSGVSALGEEPLDEIQVLSSAFACLEEGNPFLTRYNTVTWAEVVPRLPRGVPYVWGQEPQAREPPQPVRERHFPPRQL